MATKRLSITADPREEFTVDLVGKEYLATAPKGSLGMKLGEQVKEADNDPQKLWELVIDYLVVIFGKKQATAIEKRMLSAEDDLDIPHVMKLVELMTEEATGDPTT